MELDTKETLKRSFHRFFQGTLVSRISGMLRDVFMAIYFGASIEISSFMVAFRFANLFRRVFGEALMGSLFVPHFEEMRLQSTEKAEAFYKNLFYSLFFFLLGGISFTFILASFFSLKGTLLYTMIMSVGLIFISLYALNSAYLQCQKIYFIPSFAPALFNLVWIAAVFTIKEHIAFMLSITVLIAFFTQWLITQAAVKSKLSTNLLSLKDVRPFSHEIRSLLPSLGIGFIGIAASQVNSALDAIFALLSDPRAPSYLWYAFRLQQLPVALFGVGIAAALLPPLSRSLANKEQFQVYLSEAIQRGGSLMIFACLGTLLLGLPSMNLLFGHGNFTPSNVIASSDALSAYALSLLPLALTFIFTAAFHAHKNYKEPALITLLSVASNAILNTVFILFFDLGATGIALATSIATALSSLLLYYRFTKVISIRILGVAKRELLRSLFAASLAYAVGKVVQVSLGIGESLSRDFIVQLREWSMLTALYAAIYLISLYAIRIRKQVVR